MLALDHPTKFQPDRFKHLGGDRVPTDDRLPTGIPLLLHIISHHLQCTLYFSLANYSDLSAEPKNLPPESKQEEANDPQTTGS